MIDMSELTESVKGYIEGLQDVLQRKYQISEDKALNMITSSYIMDSLIDYPEETLHDDIEAHADNIVDIEEDGSVSNAYPARVKFRGFAEKNNTDGYIKVSQYLKDNVDELVKEAND